MLNLVKEIKKELLENQNIAVKTYNIKEFTFEELVELFRLASENDLDTGCHIPTGTLEFALRS